MTKTTQERLDKIYLWVKENPDKFRATQKKYRDKKKLLMTDEDRIKQRANAKKWRDANPDKVNKSKCKYISKRRREDPDYREKLIEQKRNWDERNIEHNRQYRKKRYDKIYPLNRDTILKSMHEKMVNNRYEVLYWYSDGAMQCKHCGVNYFEFLAIDHIDNNGCTHRTSGELKKYSNDISKYLLKNNFPDGYQVLCHNCNQIKRIERLPIKNTPCSRHRQKIRMLMLKKYSRGEPRCVYCGVEDIRCLAFHHVNGGGVKEKKEIGYYSLTSYLYHNDIPLDTIVVACQNCNKSLGHYGRLPF